MRSLLESVCSVGKSGKVCDSGVFPMLNLDDQSVRRSLKDKLVQLALDFAKNHEDDLNTIRSLYEGSSDAAFARESTSDEDSWFEENDRSVDLGEEAASVTSDLQDEFIQLVNDNFSEYVEVLEPVAHSFVYKLSKVSPKDTERFIRSSWGREVSKAIQKYLRTSKHFNSRRD